MPLLKRFGLFFVGLSIGLVCATYFFKNKTKGTGLEFCYLPNCRVLKNIRTKPLTYSDKVDHLLQDRILDSTDIRSFLNDGEVNFEKSQTDSEPCKIYFVEGIANGKKAMARFRNCKDSAVLEDVEIF